MHRFGLRNVVSRHGRYTRAYSHGAASNAFITQHTAELDGISTQAVRGPLEGRKIAVKDNICTAGYDTTCASSTLAGFRSPLDSTVVRLLREAGALIQGKTNMDEFGMGSHSINSAHGPVVNQGGDGKLYSAGGSSGGSAMAVTTDQSWAALGTDTGGSIRLPAAFTGTFGFKPSYGLISRNGVVAYANSLDTVGILANSTHKIQQTFSAISKFDHKDPTSVTPSTRKNILKVTPNLRMLGRPLRIGIPGEYNIEELDQDVRHAWVELLETLQDHNISISAVSIPSTKYALSTYYVLAPAEASSNLARYDGIRYGTRPEGSDMNAGTLFSRTRDISFGEEVKRRILLGTYTLSSEAMDNYFMQSQRVRRLVQRDFNRVFQTRNVLEEGSVGTEDGVDLLLCPTAPCSAPELAAVEAQTPVEGYTTDVFTVPASLAGLPAISIPLKQRDSKSSIGMQLIGQYGTDSLVLEASGLLEQLGLTNAPKYEGSKLQVEGKLWDPNLAMSYKNMSKYYGGGMKAVQWSGTKSGTKASA
ncbi:amidase signature enzyme [Microthyrium microscopicum]|uniref:Glutamyl-tRNA(Gln) amidotransferase subunit A, mitochondrial n=1 Tax=Microthyrium microscopicum TaxID=703497 RepID=A0A6A6TXD8_9PEZI|nr:amidase signature enzyme [Microthyrium microscopicum]